MRSDRIRILYLLIVIVFLIGAGFLWLDYIGLVSLNDYREKYFPKKMEKSIEAKDDEPSLLKWEELRKAQEKLEKDQEAFAVEKLRLDELQKSLQKTEEKLNEREKGLDLERKKFQDERKQYASYQKNIEDLAGKIGNMPPEGAIKIMNNWDDLLVIDVLRRMDRIAARDGKQSITSYLLFLIQQQDPNRAGNIMRKMAEYVPEPS